MILFHLPSQIIPPTAKRSQCGPRVLVKEFVDEDLALLKHLLAVPQHGSLLLLLLLSLLPTFLNTEHSFHPIFQSQFLGLLLQTTVLVKPDLSRLFFTRNSLSITSTSADLSVSVLNLKPELNLAERNPILLQLTKRS